jgi:hypothetical protein
MDNRIKEVAMLVRKAVVAHASSIGYPGNLSGMCAIASFTLARALESEGIIAIPIQGYVDNGGGHCWIEVAGNVVDVTATQFDRFKGYPYLTFSLGQKAEYGYNTHEELGIEGSYKLNFWPEEQKPVDNLIESLLENMKRLA